ncbi:MAG TPA: hypothetical protein VLJ86_21525 [Ramlibacter sp.]|nr:hypothetical protein [Ramlibacter sp.]
MGNPNDLFARLRNALWKPDPGPLLRLDGEVEGRSWRMAVGAPSRHYIKGEELRARCELDTDEDVAVVIMTRSLKRTLEASAYERYIDTNQTLSDGKLPEEMRWLATYQEAHWPSIARPFWERYAVYADQPAHAQEWLDASLAQQLMAWPAAGPGPEAPFLMMLLRGKCYLRMEFKPRTQGVFDHAVDLFTVGCERAIARWPVLEGASHPV